MRVHWGVKQPIQFKEKDELGSGGGEQQEAQHLAKELRRSYCMAINNGLDQDFLSVSSWMLMSLFGCLLDSTNTVTVWLIAQVLTTQKITNFCSYDKILQ